MNLLREEFCKETNTPMGLDDVYNYVKWLEDKFKKEEIRDINAHTGFDEEGHSLNYQGNILPLKEKSKHPKIFSENGNELFFDKKGNLIKEQAKQEIIEEVAEKLFSKEKYPTEFKTLRKAFISNAKRNQEKIYSEEDFKLFARQFYREIKLDNSNLLWEELADKCFEQFKKK